MRKLLGRASVFGALLLGLLAVPDTRAGDKAGGKTRVVIIDGQNNHQWQLTTPIMKKALEDTGRFTVDVCTTDHPDNKIPADWAARMKPVPFPPDLGKYDVVLSLTF